MTWRVDTKSVATGVMLGAGLCALVGAAASEPAGPVGRYQICCGQTTAYLVDTMTGKVWINNEREFRAPKLGSASEGSATEQTPAAGTLAAEGRRAAARPRTGPAAFLGKWVLTHPTEGQLGIQVEPDGRAILSEGSKSWEGKWQIEGNQITIVAEDQSVTAQLDDQGRLLVKEGSGEPIPFRRAE